MICERTEARRGRRRTTLEETDNATKDDEVVVSRRIADRGDDTGNSDSWRRLFGYEDVTTMASVFGAFGRSHSEDKTARSALIATETLLRERTVIDSGTFTENTSCPFR